MKWWGSVLVAFALAALLAFPVVVVAQAVGELPAVDPGVGLAPDELAAIVKSVSSGYAAFGWLGALGGLLAVVIRIARLVPGFESVWSKWPRWAQVLVPFVLSFASAGVLAGLGGGGVAGVLVGGLASGAVAVAGHQVAKASLPDGVASPKEPVGMGLGQAAQSLKVPIGGRR